MKMLETHVDKYFNSYTGETENEIYFKVYTSLFTSGLVAKLKLHNFATLMTLASYMNENGECFPTQEQLAERMGVHKNSVSKYINQLLEFKVNGKPIITREYVSRGQGRKSSFYKIQPISQLAIFDGSVEQLTKNVPDQIQSLGEEKHKTCAVTRPSKQESINKNTKAFAPKDVITLFKDQYHKQYGVLFNPSWARDTKLAKSILKKFPSDNIEEIIEIAVTEFDSRWKNNKFPRPTLGAISSFIGDQAQAIIQERKEQDREYQAYESKEEDVSKALEDKLNKIGKL